MAPTIAGQSLLCKAEDQLVGNLANSANFQSWTGAADATEARRRIDVGEMASPAAVTEDEYTDIEYAAFFPRAIMFHGDDGGWTFTQSTAGFGYVDSFKLSIELRALRGLEGSNQDKNRAFMDAAMLILEDVRNASGTAGRFGVTEGSHTFADMANPEELGNQQMSVVFTVEFRGES